MNREEYETTINTIRESMDETTRATQSENFLRLQSSFTTVLADLQSRDEEISRLENEREELLKTNGRLYQQIGFPSQNKEPSLPQPEPEQVLKITDIINEKGEFI